jgi:hypothetical protein
MGSGPSDWRAAKAAARRGGVAGGGERQGVAAKKDGRSGRARVERGEEGGTQRGAPGARWGLGLATTGRVSPGPPPKRPAGRAPAGVKGRFRPLAGHNAPLQAPRRADLRARDGVCQAARDARPHRLVGAAPAGAAAAARPRGPAAAAARSVHPPGRPGVGGRIGRQPGMCRLRPPEAGGPAPSRHHQRANGGWGVPGAGAPPPRAPPPPEEAPTRRARYWLSRWPLGGHPSRLLRGRSGGPRHARPARARRPRPGAPRPLMARRAAAARAAHPCRRRRCRRRPRRARACGSP